MNWIYFISLRHSHLIFALPRINRRGSELRSCWFIYGTHFNWFKSIQCDRKNFHVLGRCLLHSSQSLIQFYVYSLVLLPEIWRQRYFYLRGSLQIFFLLECLSTSSSANKLKMNLVVWNSFSFKVFLIFFLTSFYYRWGIVVYYFILIKLYRTTTNATYISFNFYNSSYWTFSSHFSQLQDVVRCPTES